MKRNLVLVSLLFGLYMAAAPAMAQTVLQLSGNERDVRVEGVTETAGQAVLGATTGGTVRTGSKIFLTYSTKITNKADITAAGNVVCAACGASISAAAGDNVITITFTGDVAFAVGNTITVSKVRVNANAVGAGSKVNVTASADVPAAYQATNPITFLGATTVPVANVKAAATATTIDKATKAILTCDFPESATDERDPEFKITVEEAFGSALTSRLDEEGYSNTPIPTTGTTVRVRFTGAPKYVTIWLTALTTDPATLTLTGPAVGDSKISDGTEAINFDFVIATSDTTAKEKIKMTFVAFVQSGKTLAKGAATVTAKVSLRPVADTIIRFADNTQLQATVFGVSDCVTSLLFPWVANVAGYDTGIAIVNTTADPFPTGGAEAQDGPCVLNGYDATGTNHVTFTSSSVASGAAFTMVLSSSDNAAFNGFVGYIIAVCNFQNGHGFAYIIDNFGVGAPNTAQGYSALVIPEPTVFPRSPAGEGAGEQLAQ